MSSLGSNETVAAAKSPGELMALLTASAFAASAVYNFGYFINLGFPALGFLTVQDVALSSFFWLPPAAFSLVLAWTAIGRFIGRSDVGGSNPKKPSDGIVDDPSPPLRIEPKWVTPVFIWVFVVLALQTYFFEVGAIAVAGALLAMASWVLIRALLWRRQGEDPERFRQNVFAGILLGVLILVGTLGALNFHIEATGGTDMSLVVTPRGSVTGRIMRYLDRGVLLVQSEPGSVSFLPWSEIRQIRDIGGPARKLPPICDFTNALSLCTLSNAKETGEKAASGRAAARSSHEVIGKPN